VTNFAYQITADRVTVVSANEALAAQGFTWIHFASAEDETISWLTDTAKLNEVIVETLTATESRPRCDVFENGSFINLRGLSSEKLTAVDPLASIRLWAAKDRVISVTRKELTSLVEVRRDVEAGLIRDPGDLIAAIASEITSELDPEVADLGDSLDDCELGIDVNRVFELRQQVTKVRSRSIGYRRFLNPQRAALEKLANLDAEWLEADDHIHLATAADRAARMAEELESIRERASLMHDALTDLRAEQIDTRSLLISIGAMIFLPLTFVTGLYGMNVEGIWFAHQPWAFDAIVAFCVLLSAAVAGYFIRQHWFH
jgi:zinc transporter